MVGNEGQEGQRVRLGARSCMCEVKEKQARQGRKALDGMGREGVDCSQVEWREEGSGKKAEREERLGWWEGKRLVKWNKRDREEKGVQR